MRNATWRVAAVVCLFALLGESTAATLEKLTIAEMAEKSTLIVRGRVTGCVGQARGSLIYTHCTVSVTERWKGDPGSTVGFVIPGGAARGLIQTFTGTPKFTNGDEYVLFLWAGRSGIHQVIGLSQGVFDLEPGPAGKVTAQREATPELMLDASGKPVRDENIRVRVADLKAQVRQALSSGVRK